jgi:hypothetical protein
VRPEATSQLGGTNEKDFHSLATVGSLHGQKAAGPVGALRRPECFVLGEHQSDATDAVKSFRFLVRASNWIPALRN